LLNITSQYKTNVNNDL